MFVKAIEAVDSFTKPIHTIARTYGGLISPGTSTLFFVNENGVKVDNGFHIFNTNRIGYHFKFFNNKFFIEPSIGIAGRPYHSKMPDGFKQKDDKWAKYTPEPGLHFGFNF